MQFQKLVIKFLVEILRRSMKSESITNHERNLLNKANRFIIIEETVTPCAHNYDKPLVDGTPEIVEDTHSITDDCEAVNEYEILICNNCHDKKRFFRRKYQRNI